MKKRLIIIACIYTVILVLVSQLLFRVIRKDITEQLQVKSEAGTNISVEMNEVKQLISNGDIDGALSKCDDVVTGFSHNENGDVKFILLMWLFVGLNVITVVIILIYVYIRILKPFENLKEYASDISKGNLDTPLKAEKGNYFGDFTWAFDNMRKEIVKSRNAEKTAIENNKTVVATLSHDIKTPVASIRAYAEAFEANMDSTPEKRQKYLGILMQKCDEVTTLTNDLFIHSISEMDRLEIHKEKLDIVSFMKNEIRELFADEEAEISIPESLSEASEGLFISADRKRLLQIIENLKNNADKYAKTKVSISMDIERFDNADTTDNAGDTDKSDNKVIIHFRDYGPGISEEEIPFITGKFYRGKNVGNENGSGLGLYIVKELMEKMNGELKLFNKKPGLDVVLEFMS